MIKFFAQNDAFLGQTKIGIRIGDGVLRSVVEPISLRVEQHGMISPYFIDGNLGVVGEDDFGGAFLRAALNCAWDMGLRPDGFNDTREAIAASSRHLDDMRAITFAKLGIEKP